MHYRLRKASSKCNRFVKITFKRFYILRIYFFHRTQYYHQFSPLDTRLCCINVYVTSLHRIGVGTTYYYIPIAGTTLELSTFWPSDTESRISMEPESENMLM